MPAQDDNPVIGPPLKITLVNNPSDFAPEESETLAQAHSEGEEDAAASTPPTPQINQNLEQASNQKQKDEDEIFDDLYSDTKVKESTNSNDENSEEISLSREQLIEEIDLAYLNAQAKPREKYVSARAKESVYAAYIEKWRILVERVGNLNYPDAAKNQQLEASLVLDVALNANGEIEYVRILESSGFKVLDDAAEQIVHIASPFDRFPEQIRKEIDVMHIVRTWEFGEGELSSKIYNTQ